MNIAAMNIHAQVLRWTNERISVECILMDVSWGGCMFSSDGQSSFAFEQMLHRMGNPHKVSLGERVWLLKFFFFLKKKFKLLQCNPLHLQMQRLSLREESDLLRLKLQQSHVQNPITRLKMSYGFLSSLTWGLNITQTGCWSDVERTPQFKSEALGSSPNIVTTQCVTQERPSPCPPMRRPFLPCWTSASMQSQRAGPHREALNHVSWHHCRRNVNLPRVCVSPLSL